MQLPQSSNSGERPLRRLHLTRSSSDPQCSSDCFATITGRLDNKLEKQSSPTSSLMTGEMPGMPETDHGSEHLLIGGTKKVSMMEQTVRRNRAVASYFLGGLLSLFLLVQMITGGFRLIDSPLKVSRFKQVPVEDNANNAVFEEQKTHVKCIEATSSKDAQSIPEVQNCVNVSKKMLERSEKDLTSRSSLWSQPNSRFHECIHRSNYQKRTTDATNGYLMAFANGGLNQMRTAICDMVAVARLLNATLVIPDLDHASYWDDPSNFEDIFDVDHFIRHLEDDIRVVKTLPPHIKSSQVFQLAPKSWSEATYYQNEILPLLRKHKVLRFTLTDSRLANNRVPDEIQRLRCRANYKALRFEYRLRTLGRKIIKRLKEKGSYIALHLRYEKDMLAFSGCTAGLSNQEANELKSIRYNTSRWKEKEINPVSRRASGGCPLTPFEIGLLLKAMGYPQNTTIYIAAGKLYGGKRRMKSFTSFYQNVVTKETVTTLEELEPFKKYQNRLAALDYMVAVESDVFVPTYDGNMARAVQGHRRFQGHRKTLIPDRARLVKILDDFQSGELDWNSVRLQVQRSHRNKQGHPHYRKALAPSHAKLEENFYANPLPGCICEYRNRTELLS